MAATRSRKGFVNGRKRIVCTTIFGPYGGLEHRYLPTLSAGRGWPGGWQRRSDIDLWGAV